MCENMIWSNLIDEWLNGKEFSYPDSVKKNFILTT